MAVDRTHDQRMLDNSTPKKRQNQRRGPTATTLISYLTMAPTPGTELNLSFVSTASRDRLRRVTTSRNRVAVSRAELLDLFLLAFLWSSWLGTISW